MTFQFNRVVPKDLSFNVAFVPAQTGTQTEPSAHAMLTYDGAPVYLNKADCAELGGELLRLSNGDYDAELFPPTE